MNWKSHIQTLDSESILLEPLEEKHIPALLAIADAAPEIWTHYAFDGSNPQRLEEMLNNFIQYKDEGKWLPFVIILKENDTIIGSTCLIDMDEKNRKLEIGATWLNPKFWGSFVNFQCKLLLLTYCFETLKTIRVYLRTDANNIRSQKAIAKIGAKYEGTFRKDMIRDNGIVRDSMYFSFIDDEWESSKTNLSELLKNAIQKNNSL